VRAKARCVQIDRMVTGRCVQPNRYLGR